MVDDESKPERRPAKHMKTPEEWDLKHNPAYAYYAFYTYANLYTLNKLREARGLNTFALRPHAGPSALPPKHAPGLLLWGPFRILTLLGIPGLCHVDYSQHIEVEFHRKCELVGNHMLLGTYRLLN